MEIESLIKRGKINALHQFSLEEIQFLDKENLLVQLVSFDEKVVVKKYIIDKTSCDEKRMVNSLKLVSLTEDILNKKMCVLSSTEILKLQLAILLIQNVDCLFFYQFDRYFMDKELLFFKKLFKKLVTKYGKTIAFFDSRLEFMFDLVDRIVIKDRYGKLKTFLNPTFYEEELLSFFEVPEIISFIRYVNRENKKLLGYTDLKELMKAIYREV